MRERAWLVVWLIISLSIFLAANLYTNSPIFDLTIGHAAIAGILGLALTAICFGIVESISFIVSLAKKLT